MDTNLKSAPPQKKQGPIRFEYIIPITVILALVYGYFHFFFDGHLRRGMEWVGTQINGAEVDVGEFQTSFFGGSLRIANVEVTDKNKPQRNLVQIGEIKFNLLWDALLRMKFVIEEASVQNIQALSPRKSPGRVLPPPKKSDSSLMNSMEAKLTENIQGRINGSALGDLASIASGVNVSDQLKTIQASLKTEARIKEINQMFDEKKKAWDERLQNLPQAKDFEDLQTEAKKLKFEGNPLEVAQNVKKADELIKKADAKLKEITKAKKDLDSDVKSLNGSVSEIENFVQQDISDLQGRLKLPSLNAQDISKDLFLSYVGKYLVQYQKYSEIAKQYLPPKKDPKAAAAEAVVPRKRSEGRNFKFPVTAGYPLFHLKRAALSSETSQGEYAGRISGEIVDLSSDPIQLGRPLVINIAGDFPKAQVLGLKVQAIIDHTTDLPKQTLEASIDAFPLEGLMLSESADVKFGFKKAVGQTDITGLLSGDEFSFKVLSNFKSIQYAIDAKDKLVTEILTKVAGDIPIVTLKAQLTGKFDDFKVGIDTNFGTELGESLKRQVDSKIKEAQDQVRKFVEDKIKGEKEKLTGEVDKIKAQLTVQMDKQKGEIEAEKNKFHDQVKGMQSGGIKGKKPEDKLKKEGEKKLKKMFGL